MTSYFPIPAKPAGKNIVSMFYTYLIHFSIECLTLLENIQIRQLLQLMHTLLICLHHLLIVKHNPASVNTNMCDIMARVNAGSFVRDEGFEFIFGWKGGRTAWF